MKIALHNADTKTAPNLALAKLAAYHRKQGDSVSFFMPLFTYDKVYSSKVFTFSKSNGYLPSNTITGGTGYGKTAVLGFQNLGHTNQEKQP